MEFKYCDRNGKYLRWEELEKLALWNPVMEHILAEALRSNATEEITSSDPLVDRADAVLKSL